MRAFEENSFDGVKTGSAAWLVAGAFVLSSLYHVFGVTKLKDIARFSLVFSFALLPCAPMPLLLHLQQPLRNHHVLMTPHFTSAIAAFGIVFLTYVVVALLTWRAQGWSLPVAVLAVAASVPPLGTLAFEEWARRTGRLDVSPPGPPEFTSRS